MYLTAPASKISAEKRSDFRRTSTQQDPGLRGQNCFEIIMIFLDKSFFEYKLSTQIKSECWVFSIYHRLFLSDNQHFKINPVVSLSLHWKAPSLAPNISTVVNPSDLSSHVISLGNIIPLIALQRSYISCISSISVILKSLNVIKSNERFFVSCISILTVWCKNLPQN